MKRETYQQFEHKEEGQVKWMGTLQKQQQQPLLRRNAKIPVLRWRTVYYCLGASAIALCIAMFHLYDNLRIHLLQESASSNHSAPAAATEAAAAKHPNNNNANLVSPVTPFHNPQHWPLLKQIMCPNQSPNPNVWSTLFQLARFELLGLPKDPHPSDLIAFDSFFKFNYGGLGYYYYASNNNSTNANNDEQNLMIYLRIFKAGNDQIRHNLQHLLGTTSSKVENWNTIYDIFTSDIVKKTKPQNMCVVTAVRDPIEHFMSAYNEVEFRQEEKQREEEGNDAINGEKKKKKKTLPSYTRHGNGTVLRFEQFVKDLVDGPRSHGLFDGYKMWGVQQITHIFSMTGILWGLHRIKECQQGKHEATPSSSSLNLTSYLPSLHNLDTEFPKLLHQTCPHPGTLFPSLSSSFNKRIVHESQSDKYNFHSAAKTSWKEQGKVSRALCALHALDYACFDDIPVPALCQEVYSSDAFRRRLLGGTKTGGQQGQLFVQMGPRDSCGRGHFP